MCPTFFWSKEIVCQKNAVKKGFHPKVFKSTNLLDKIKGEILPLQLVAGQMSLGRLRPVRNCSRNPTLKLRQNHLNNSLDIADIEFVRVVGWLLGM